MEERVGVPNLEPGGLEDKGIGKTHSPDSTLWHRIAQPADDPQYRKMAWRLLRQFQDGVEFQTEFDVKLEWNWQIVQQSGSLDTRAIKLLLENAQGRRCETVALFPNGHAGEDTAASGIRRLRATACVSSQLGCGVGCPFCATGQLGHQGNLSAEEIVEQVYWTGLLARRAGRRLRNVVFMGMGEPLHNTQAVFDAIRMLTSEQYFGLSPKRITVSTAGVPAAMLQLAGEFPRLRIALSLHAAEPELRRLLVPRALGDLETLRRTMQQINALQANQPVWLEVVLFENLNDSSTHAQSLIDFCAGLHVEVNLIPYNTVTSASFAYVSASQSSREQFASRLRTAGIRTTMRTSFGSGEKAACGQLNALT